MTRATDIFVGGGEAGAVMRSMDWSRTPLGPPSRWPQSLRTAVGILLDSRYPMFVFWGPELVKIYNDAYRPITGAKHPWAMGRPGPEVWPEIWHTIGPMVRRVVDEGEATWSDDLMLFMERNGFPEEVYFTFSYSPIRDESGGVGGLFCACTETTEKVLGQRRLETLRDLARAPAEARTGVEACSRSCRVLAAVENDIPFSMLYLLEGDGVLRFVDGTGIQRGADVCPTVVRPGDDSGWPFFRVMETLEAEVVAPLSSSFSDVPRGPWPEAPERALVLPLAAPGHERAMGVVVLGVGSRRTLDEPYRDFASLVASQIGTSVAAARSSEEERRRAEALAELDRAKTAFFSNVSHEFRTPLTLMLAPLADLLADADALSEVSRGRIEVAHRNALRLLKLVNSLLDFSRIEAGRLEASFEPLDLSALTAELASFFRAAIERAGLTYVVRCSSLPEPVYADREMWEKIVFNLISNAFKFTFEGEIEIALSSAGDDAVVLSVRDTGTGVPPDEVPRLFERFHRVKHARGRSFEGTGIGLALVQELVKLHGGHIAVESELDAGTRFTVTLPLGKDHLPADRIRAPRTLASTSVRGETYIEDFVGWRPADTGDLPSAAPAEVPSVSGPTGAPRILLAEDNADLRDYVRGLLRDRYEVQVVGDGKSALAAARRHPPDLVLTDVMMPELGGFGLLRGLREDPELRSVPIILLSARAGEEARLDALNAGADDYLVKPFSARELLARISARLELSGLQRRLRTSIETSEARYRHIFEAAPVSIFEEDFSRVKEVIDELRRSGVTDFARYFEEHPELVVEAVDMVRIVDVNQGALALFGARDKSELTASLDRVFLRESQTVFIKELVAIAEGRELLDCEGVVRTLSGEPLDVLVSISFSPSDAELHSVLVTLVDITARKAAERALVEEAQTLETLNEVGRALAAQLDLERLMQSVTDAATLLSGADSGAFFYRQNEGSDDRFRLHTRSGRSSAVEQLCAPTASGLFDPVFEGRGAVRIGDAGAEGVRSCLAVPVVSRASEVLGALFFGHPRANVFTERAERIVIGIASHAAVAIDNARLHEQRLHLIEQLREVDRRKDEFLAMLGHELRNPLGAIRNATELLRLSASADTRVDRAREVLDRQTHHVTSLVDGLLEMSRISRGKIAIDAKPIDLREVVTRVVTDHRERIEAHGLQLVATIEDDPVFVHGDGVRLVQIFDNLLTNARKFTDPPGSIHVALEEDEEGAVARVRDTGIGLGAASLHRIFEPFQQETRDIARSTGGLGLGLALVKALVELHEGSVEAQSAGPGQGTEFTVRIPTTKGRPANRVEAPRERSAPRRILLVEDNEDLAEMLQEVLRLRGHEVVVADNGPRALELVHEARADVVLCDIGLPGMTGYEVASAMRQDARLDDVTLVALTGYGQPEDRNRTREAGFDAHLVKPVDIADLTRVITRGRAD